ncbi:MAG: ATP-dependent Clp protease ATP-binding subunit, partial [Aquificota bacterium]
GDTIVGIVSVFGLILITKYFEKKAKKKVMETGTKDIEAREKEKTFTYSTSPKSFRSLPRLDFSYFFDYTSNYIVGQERALKMVQKSLIASAKRLSMGDKKKAKVLSVMLFVGPTGVGKTETAKVLAEYLKVYDYGFLRIDANQYSTREAVWSLLGSMKGYIGSDQPGILPRKIAENPRIVILIDEIEKASRSFYEPLLQLLDEGYVIERSTGEEFHTQAAVIIMTSNIESRKIGSLAESISDPVELDIKVREVLERAIRHFDGGYEAFQITPEFLGRIDAIVPFSSLKFDHLVLIAQRELQRMGVKPDQERLRLLAYKYKELADKYGIRYFIKKLTEEFFGGVERSVKKLSETYFTTIRPVTCVLGLLILKVS